MKYIKDLTNKEVILAPTKEISDKLRLRFDELGLKWSCGLSYKDTCFWIQYVRYTAYLPKLGKYGPKDSSNLHGYTFYNIDDLLDFEGDIKSGEKSSEQLEKELGYEVKIEE